MPQSSIAKDKFNSYMKLLDGINLQTPQPLNSICDLSFNDYITAAYLIKRRHANKVYALTNDNECNYQSVIPVQIQPSFTAALTRQETDYFISLGGMSFFRPIPAATKAIFNTLKYGGSFYFAVSPLIYDEDGKDLLAKFQQQKVELALRDKLLRWHEGIYKSLSNFFLNITKDDIIVNATADEIRALYSSDAISSFYLSHINDYNNLLSKLDDKKKYYIAWLSIRGDKI